MSKRNTVYQPYGVYEELRTMAFKERKSQQALLREAIDMLLADRNRPSWSALEKVKEPAEPAK